MLHLEQLHRHLFEDIDLLPLFPYSLELKVLIEAALDLLHIFQQARLQFFGALVLEVVEVVSLLLDGSDHIGMEELVRINDVVHILLCQVHVIPKISLLIHKVQLIKLIYTLLLVKATVNHLIPVRGHTLLLLLSHLLLVVLVP